MPPRGHPTRHELISARDLGELAQRLAETEEQYDLLGHLVGLACVWRWRPGFPRPPAADARTPSSFAADRASGGTRRRAFRAVRTHARHGPHQLRDDLSRFTFLLGGSDGERLFGR
jgi:hypothetical protein